MIDVLVKGRTLRTPQGHPFQTPTLLLAQAIEEEWVKDPSSTFQKKPLTSLTATALDKVPCERDSFIIYALHVIEKDVILFWTEKPAPLVTLQKEKWAPLIERVNRLLKLTLSPTFSFEIPRLSPPEEERLKEFLKQLSNFTLAGFCHLLTLTSSFYLSYLVLKGNLSAKKAWNLAYLHEHTQRTLWGEDEETISQEKKIYEELLETVRFLRLSQ
jgi:chaperone required for assembly of F1-ATPase